MLFFLTFYSSMNPEKGIKIKILSSTTVYNLDNNRISNHGCVSIWKIGFKIKQTSKFNIQII